MSERKMPDYEQDAGQWLLFVAGLLVASVLWIFFYFSKVLPGVCS